ncbi:MULTISPECIES: hypothetical protein [unclassified Mesorhizobium]|uniref:hypothetical protein n=1 Tax=unclassified Mesorhizobium TaxID=325217 RepID=UPI003014ABE5
MAKSSKKTPLKGGTFRQRLNHRLEPLRWFAHEYAVALAMLVAAAAFGVYMLLPLHSPVVKREQVSAVITTIVSTPLRPSRGGGSYQYAVIPNGTTSLIVVRDDLSPTLIPREVGATIELERRTRANGTVTYHMSP